MDKPWWLRGIRGATTVADDTPELILEATRELLLEILAANGIDDYDVIASIFFTTTQDLRATFPAEAARAIGMTTVPLICNQEIPVPGRLPRCVRVLMLVITQLSHIDMVHYLQRES